MSGLLQLKPLRIKGSIKTVSILAVILLTLFCWFQVLLLAKWIPNPIALVVVYPKASHHSGLGEMNSRVTLQRFHYLWVIVLRKVVKRLLMMSFSHTKCGRRSLLLNWEVWMTIVYTPHCKCPCTHLCTETGLTCVLSVFLFLKAWLMNLRDKVEIIFKKSGCWILNNIIKIFFYAARDTVAAVLPLLIGKGNWESN